MPHRLKRFLLAVAIAIAVPVQGFAAVSAGLCMALGHHDSPVDTAGEAHPDGHDHGATGHGPCGPCMGCCASAAIAGTSGIALQLPRIPAPVAAAPLQPAGVAPDKLDRPPLAL